MEDSLEDGFGARKDSRYAGGILYTIELDLKRIWLRLVRLRCSQKAGSIAAVLPRLEARAELQKYLGSSAAGVLYGGFESQLGKLQYSWTKMQNQLSEILCFSCVQVFKTYEVAGPAQVN